MINLDELKPILEPLGLSADAIDAIIQIDRPVENDSEKIAELTKKLEDQEKSWNERYQKTFFNGTGEPHDHENEITDQVDDQSGDDDGSELATTYDELFG